MEMFIKSKDTECTVRSFGCLNDLLRAVAGLTCQSPAGLKAAAPHNLPSVQKLTSQLGHEVTLCRKYKQASVAMCEPPFALRFAPIPQSHPPPPCLPSIMPQELQAAQHQNQELAEQLVDARAQLAQLLSLGGGGLTAALVDGGSGEGLPAGAAAAGVLPLGQPDAAAAAKEQAGGSPLFTQLRRVGWAPGAASAAEGQAGGQPPATQPRRVTWALEPGAPGEQEADDSPPPPQPQMGWTPLPSQTATPASALRSGRRGRGAPATPGTARKASSAGSAASGHAACMAANCTH